MLGSDIKEQLNELAAHLEEHLSDSLIAIEWERDELILRAQRQTLITVMTFLKDDSKCLFRTLVDLCGVDYPEEEFRFEVVYNLLSLKRNMRIRVKVRTDAETAVPSLNKLVFVGGMERARGVGYVRYIFLGSSRSEAIAHRLRL